MDYYHLIGITAYFFPKRIYVCKPYEGTFGDTIYWEMFNNTRMDMDDLSNPDRFKNRTVWIIVPENINGQANIAIPSIAEFCGRFGWDFYQFNLYRTNVQAANRIIEKREDNR
jgi:hypothetical protein